MLGCFQADDEDRVDGDEIMQAAGGNYDDDKVTMFSLFIRASVARSAKKLQLGLLCRDLAAQF